MIAMTGRYIPPALRKAAKSEGSTANANGGDGDETAPRKLSELKVKPEHARQVRPLLTLHELANHYHDTASKVGSTLHSSAAAPHSPSYIVLYRGSNPRWHQDKIIFVKTNIDLLPGYHSFPDTTAQSDTSNADDVGITAPTSPVSEEVQTTIAPLAEKHRPMIPIWLEVVPVALYFTVSFASLVYPSSSQEPPS